MDIHTFVHSLLTATALIASIAGAVYAARSGPRFQIRKLLEACSLLEEELDTQRARIVKLNSQYALLLAREKRHADTRGEEAEPPVTSEQLPGESGDAWKARMRALQARGKLTFSHK